ncbi:uncharacterized protein LOC144701004 isoform X1 [Wolffia australiana]
MTGEVLGVTKKHHRRINNPFPAAAKGLPLIRGSLFYEPTTLSTDQIHPIGDDFLLIWTPAGGGQLSVAATSDPRRHIAATVPGEAFVSAAAAATTAEESRGSLAISDGQVFSIAGDQFVRRIETVHLDGGRACVVAGWVAGEERRRRRAATAAFSAVFRQESRRQVSLHVAFGGVVLGERRRRRRNLVGWTVGRRRRRRLLDEREEEEEEEREMNRVVVTLGSEAKEKIFGFGEQFSRVEFKGRRVPILVQEQGIGRGDQPITFAANLVSHRSGGDWSSTYAPSPFYMTSKMRSAFLEGHGYSVFDLTAPDRIQIQVYGSSAKLRILDGKTPVELVETFTETVGRPPELPPWIISGAVVGMQGGTHAVRRTWDKLKKHDVPISAFWLQDWVGQRQTIIGSQLWWNWELDGDRYPSWEELVGDLRAHGIRVMAYCNPCLALTEGKLNRKRNLFKEAENLDILVKDGFGSTYLVPNTAFDVGMVDFTHPAAGEWFKRILQGMVDCGVSGWMADFGEGLPLDAKLYSGEDPISAHNRYPEMWAKVNREFVDSETATKEEDEGLVFFMRAGFRDSPRWAMLFWEGDQMVSWQRNDGIKSSVVGLLSGGLSGFALNHSDIGGYCSVNVPGVRYRRSEELLLRWMELNAFNVVFRTHEGNKPSTNCQFYSNDRTLSHFARFAKVYKAWKFYRVQLVKEASKRGLPVVRHLFLHYPEDERVHRLSYEQFLVGTEIMVAPVLDQGRREVEVYFPRGDGRPWRHVWSGRLLRSEARVEAPLGYPAVFVRDGSPVGDEFLKNLGVLRII